MKKFRLTFSAGLGRKGNGSPITDSERMEALHAIRKELADRFGGYSETIGNGGWINDAGELVQEASATWVCVSDIGEPGAERRAEITAENVAGRIAAALEQEAVLATTEALQSVAFVSPRVPSFA